MGKWTVTYGKIPGGPDYIVDLLGAGAAYRAWTRKSAQTLVDKLNEYERIKEADRYAYGLQPLNYITDLERRKIAFADDIADKFVIGGECVANWQSWLVAMCEYHNLIRERTTTEYERVEE